MFKTLGTVTSNSKQRPRKIQSGSIESNLLLSFVKIPGTTFIDAMMVHIN